MRWMNLEPFIHSEVSQKEKDKYILMHIKCIYMHHSQQKSRKCSTWMQSQKRQNDLCSFPRQTIQHHGNPSLCPTSNAEEAEVEPFYEDLQDLLELSPQRCPFQYRGLECKSRKSRNTWRNRQIWPWNKE